MPIMNLTMLTHTRTRRPITGRAQAPILLTVSQMVMAMTTPVTTIMGTPMSITTPVLAGL
jgi:hypothetical protein